jgi:DNA-binding MarR family transcriptional regulator
MSDTAAALEQQLWDLVYAYDAAFDRAARDAGLTAAQACLLTCLSHGSCTMGDLATELLCDASNVTQLVGRLEDRGLVTREPDPDDRRARRVSITAAGRRQRRAIEQVFTFPTERIGRLSDAEQRRLRELLDGLLGDGGD